jgi:hypothetical protein
MSMVVTSLPSAAAICASRKMEVVLTVGEDVSDPGSPCWAECGHFDRTEHSLVDKGLEFSLYSRGVRWQGLLSVLVSLSCETRCTG